MIPIRSRKWPWILGICLLLLALGGLALYLDRWAKPATPAELVNYFPAREAVVLYIDVNAIRASGILEKLVGTAVGSAAVEDAEYRNFVSGSGFDYKRDLDRVMLNSSGAIHYFVLDGRFDWKKLKAYATSQGGQCREEDCNLKGSTPGRVISWRKLRPNLMALASARDESGSRAIEPRSPEKPAFDLPQTPVWLHLPAETLRASQQLPPGTRLFAKALEGAERAVFSLGPEGDHFSLAADVTCRNPEEAAVLRAQLEGITKMLNSLIARENKAPSAADLSGVLASGQFERVQQHVRARWVVGKSFIESLGGS